jgi:ATP-binding cassette subfamily B protein
MNTKLALLMVLMLPPMLVTAVLFGKYARVAFRNIRTRLARINAFIQEAISGLSIIQLFLRQKDMYDSFTRVNDSYYRATLYHIKVFGTFMPLIEVLHSFSLAIIIWYGGGEIIRKQLTLGDLTAFIAYMRLFFQPVRELAQKYSIVQSAMASAERIFQLLDAKELLPVQAAPVAPSSNEGRIRFNRVKFEYEPGRPVIHDLSFEVNGGETLAIVGATGSGKTTIINLLERFYDPISGTVEIDGVDLRYLDPFWIRQTVGLVMQEVFIVPGDIKENIVLNSDFPDERLQRVIELSQLSEMLKRLPQGLNTRIGEGGMDLSAGQRQLLSFARVLARDPRILVLDEATANVDTETEMLVEQAIQAALANRTSIVIAHRLSTIRRADRILVMDRGRIVESGAHDVLMERQGLYFQLQTFQNGTC